MVGNIKMNYFFIGRIFIVVIAHEYNEKCYLKFSTLNFMLQCVIMCLKACPRMNYSGYGF